MSTPVFCTSICANYLGKALTLATSVKQVYPDAKFIIGLVEKGIPDALDLDRYSAVDQIVLAKDLLGDGLFDSWVFRYSIVEASTAIKGLLLKHLYEYFPDADHVIYLDPDTYVYSRFDELFALLDIAPIVITPHLEVPGNLEMELSALKHGVFNLGFLAVSRDAETERFLNWWISRLDHACYDDIPNGIFTDQKWINLAPCFFRTQILREPGYNFATWSLLDRELTRNAQDEYLVNGSPLRFAHFSGFDSGMFHRCVDRWASNNSEKLRTFADEYSVKCELHQASYFKRIRWSYMSFNSGKSIWRIVRICWRECYGRDERNPFGLGNIPVLLSVFNKSRLNSLLKKLVSRYA